MSRSPIVRAFSAGGVVYRHTPALDEPSAVGASSLARPQIVLVGRAWEHFWALPKGTPLPGETVEEVALREVREETGISARVIRTLGSIEYEFARNGVRYHKEVCYYLMEATGGDTTLHDHEYDDARWFDAQDAPALLSYRNEAEIAQTAVALLGR